MVIMSTNTQLIDLWIIGIKDAILEISQVATGLIYPEVNFKPREAQSAA